MNTPESQAFQNALKSPLTPRPKTAARVAIEVTCIECKKPQTITCCPEDYADFKAGALIGWVLPYLSDGERELLISQICGPCFDKLFEDDASDAPWDGPDPDDGGRESLVDA